ncbi:MAG: NAD-dependent epimerase/dehydratase family protein [Hyphomicrobiaceae bacterium]
MEREQPGQNGGLRACPRPRMPEADLPDDVLSRIGDEAERVENLIGAGRRRHILIVGGSGYIGGPLTTELLRNGYDVRNLDLQIYDHHAAMTGYLQHPGYDYRYGDIGNAGGLDAALDGITDVIILAGLVGDPITKKYPDEAHAINDLGIRNFIDGLNDRGLNKVVFVSTCSNYGIIDEDSVADEDFELKPLSLYAKSKVAAEQYITSLKGQIDYHPTVLRFATAFGLAPRMRFDLTVNEFTRELYLDKELLVYDADTWRPYCHVRDFSRLIDRVLQFPASDVSFEVFNAGGDANNHTKQSIVDLICKRLPDRKVSYKAHSDDPRNYRVSFEKVREKLLFEPAFSVADGIDETIWALGSHLFEDVDARPNFYGNYELTYTALLGVGN